MHIFKDFLPLKDLLRICFKSFAFGHILSFFSLHFSSHASSFKLMNFILPFFFLLQEVLLYLAFSHHLTSEFIPATFLVISSPLFPHLWPMLLHPQVSFPPKFPPIFSTILCLLHTNSYGFPFSSSHSWTLAYTSLLLIISPDFFFAVKCNIDGLITVL